VLAWGEKFLLCAMDERNPMSLSAADRNIFPATGREASWLP
jgi:hypothetical protein